MLGIDISRTIEHIECWFKTTVLGRLLTCRTVKVGFILPHFRYLKLS